VTHYSLALAQYTLALVNSKTSTLARSTMTLAQSTSALAQSVALFAGNIAQPTSACFPVYIDIFPVYIGICCHTISLDGIEDTLFSTPIHLKFQPVFSFSYLFCQGPSFIPRHVFPFVVLTLDSMVFKLTLVVVVDTTLFHIFFLRFQVVRESEVLFE
jgi:hypothetical protein